MREGLLDAAFAALLAEGPGFGAAAVARHAGASKALVFHHFGSREGLLDAMAARVLAQTQEGLARLADDYPDPRRRLDALARTLLEEPQDATPQQARHVLAFWLATDATGGCRAQLRDALVADFVEKTLREAGLRAPGLADLLLTRWHGATVLYASGRPVDFEREARALADAVAAALAR
ncbi:MAG TPA: TetR family transcriptional regulator [Candidatus Thermoplasmatota archaeon]|nr:TetR family transcriptional regulator [Candidatus Thermoplasmatota archaeon]